MELHMKKSESAKTVKLSARKSQLDALEDVCKVLVTRRAQYSDTGFEMLVTACALVGEKATDHITRKDFMQLANEVCFFTSHGSSEICEDLDHCDMQKAVHRSYSDRAGVNVAHTNDSLLDVILKEQKRGKRLVSMRIAPNAYKVLVQYAKGIAEHNSK